MNNLSKESRHAGKDLNPESSKYISESSLLEPISKISMSY
jgi:hypothetical protein